MANNKNHRAALRAVAEANTKEQQLEAAEELALAEFNLSQLLANRARDNPHLLFGCDELAHMCGLSIDAIYAARKAGARFPFGKSRPEWMHEFLRSGTGGALSIKTSRR